MVLGVVLVLGTMEVCNVQLWQREWEEVSGQREGIPGLPRMGRGRHEWGGAARDNMYGYVRVCARVCGAEAHEWHRWQG